MKPASILPRSLILLLMLAGVSQVCSQELAMFSSLSGKVVVKKSNGHEVVAGSKTRLSSGDVVKLDRSARAVVFYYTGREVPLQGGQEYRVGGEEKSASAMAGLGKIVSSLLWGDDNSTMVAGATRQSPAQMKSSPMYACYPAETKIMEERPVFRWMDTRATPAHNYTVTIRSEISNFSSEIPLSLLPDDRSVEGERVMREAVYPPDAPSLQVDERYIWSVKDDQGVISPPAHFSLLHPADQSSLKLDLARILEICGGDRSQPKWLLLTAALYWDYRLMKQAEEAMVGFITQKPEMAQAHRMLATLYHQIGRAEDAQFQEQRAEELAEAR